MEKLYMFIYMEKLGICRKQQENRNFSELFKLFTMLPVIKQSMGKSYF